MANLTDVFNSDAFDVLKLTSAIEKIPPQETTLMDLGIFTPTPVNGTLISVEERDHSLALLPTTQRGQRGVENKVANRKVRNFRIPHIQVDDTVFADDLTNVRRFGTNDVESGVGQVVGDRLIDMRRSIDTTTEYLMAKAIHGNITYPTNSVDADLSLYTEFGTTETTIDMVLDTTTTKVMDKIASIRDAVEAALGGPAPNILVICGREFFRALSGHAVLRDLYLAQSQFQAQLGNVDFMKPNRQRLTAGGVTFVEYYSNTSGATGIDTDHARVIPMVDIYKLYIAQADFNSAAGTMGQQFYGRSWEQTDGKGMVIEAQSNILPICLRPKALIKLIQNS